NEEETQSMNSDIDCGRSHLSLLAQVEKVSAHVVVRERFRLTPHLVEELSNGKQIRFLRPGTKISQPHVLAHFLPPVAQCDHCVASVFGDDTASSHCEKHDGSSKRQNLSYEPSGRSANRQAPLRTHGYAVPKLPRE